MSVLSPEFYHYCLDQHQDVGELDFVVRDSIPIPFFGNVGMYMKSPLRVLTAALNPSDAEFPLDNPRFDIAQGLRGADELEAELSAYFERAPYRSWFGSFEPVLNGLEASYGGKMAATDYRHTALHVDMCSPIATRPTWSRLKTEQRRVLSEAGRETFERLVDELKPHIVIASLGWGHIENWHSHFRAGRSWKPILTYTTQFDGKPLRRGRLLVQASALTSRGMHNYLFANGSAANTPFGRFHKERRRVAGSTLLDLLRGTQ